MDNTDLKILSLLQEDSRISFTNVSKKVNLSVPSVIERINRLKENGIIIRNTIEIDYKKLGYDIEAIISIDARSNTYNDFRNFCKSHPNILDIYKVVGTYNTIISVILKNTDELEQLVEQIKKYAVCSTSIVTSVHSNNSLLG